MNNNIKNSKSIRVAAALSFAAVAALGTAYGGVPLNNLQGAGGIAFNPLAYTAGQPWEGGESNSLNNVVSKPQFGAWYVNLNDADINWGAFGAAFTVANRLEISAGYELVNARKYGDRSINKYNIGAKLRLLDEKLNELRALLSRKPGNVQQPEVTFVWFEPDERKDGGAYVTRTGIVKKIDDARRAVLLEDGILIPMDALSDIEF